MGILGEIRQKAAIETGLRSFAKSGKTPSSAYLAMRWQHWFTAGGATDALAARLAKSHPPQKERGTGLLSDEHDAALRALQTQGVYVFQRQLPESLCAALEQFARETPALLHPRPDDSPDFALYDEKRPLAKTYHFSEDEILEQSASQTLLADVSFRALARDYLGCEPVFDLAAMWWSTPTVEASSAAAQLYHFDLDRVAWVKFFIYLSDVTPTRGPHCYLRGTHKTGEASRKILTLGDRRIQDEEIEALELKANELEICGPRGTIFVGDTRGHHKGKPPENGDRLVLELEFSNSLFGAPYQNVELKQTSVELKETLKNAPRVLSRLKVKV